MVFGGSIGKDVNDLSKEMSEAGKKAAVKLVNGDYVSEEERGNLVLDILESFRGVKSNFIVPDTETRDRMIADGIDADRIHVAGEMPADVQDSLVEMKELIGNGV